MTWIDTSDVEIVYPTSNPSIMLVAHVQRLAEAVIGPQDTPTDALKGVMVEIVHRFAAAAAEDPNVQQESLGSWSQTRRVGLGLTDREKGELRTAVGKGGLWTQQTTRDDVETPGPNHPAQVLRWSDDKLWRPL